MNVSRLVSHAAQSGYRTERPAERPGRQAEKPDFTATLSGEIDKSEPAAPQPRIVPNLSHEPVKPGDLIDMGGGVYYNTGNRTYQNLSGSIVALNGAAVQQYTDPESFLACGAAYQPSDAHIRNTNPELNADIPPSAGSPTFILNARWAYEKICGAPPLTVFGTPAWEHQAEPVALMAFPGVLKAPGPPPLAGKTPPDLDSAPEST